MFSSLVEGRNVERERIRDMLVLIWTTGPCQMELSQRNNSWIEMKKRNQTLGGVREVWVLIRIKILIRSCGFKWFRKLLSSVYFGLSVDSSMIS